MAAAIDREMLRRVLDKYIPQLIGCSVVFIGNPEFNMHTASEGTVRSYVRMTRHHLRALRKSLPLDEELLIKIVRNFDADILAVYHGETPPHINDA